VLLIAFDFSCFAVLTRVDKQKRLTMTSGLANARVVRTNLQGFGHMGGAKSKSSTKRWQKGTMKTNRRGIRKRKRKKTEKKKKKRNKSKSR